MRLCHLHKKSDRLYFLCIAFGWGGAHQSYLTQISKKPLKHDNLHVLRDSPFVVGWIAMIIGFNKSFNEENGFFHWLDLIFERKSADFFYFLKSFEGFKFIFIGLAIIIVFWIIDLFILGKQVDRWNAKHASY